MNDKEGSILDYQHKELRPDIWNRDKKLRPSVKNFIFSSVAGFFESLDLRGYDDFVIDMYVGSSLATYFYTKESDFDVKVVIDTITFKIHNSKYSESSEDDIMDMLCDKSKETTWTTAYIPATKHRLDIYFLSAKEASSISMLRYDSIYNLMTDNWLKTPKQIEGHAAPSYVLNYARSMARKFLEKLSLDIAQAQRDSIDYLILKDQLKELEESDLSRFREDLEISLDRINASVEELSEAREVIKGIREKTFEKRKLQNQLENMMKSLNYADGNLIFKLVQRYGYMSILSEIDKIYKDKKVTPKEVEEVAKILS